MQLQLSMSVGAVALVIGTVGVIFSALSTQWIIWKVDRSKIQLNREVVRKLESSFEHNPIYFQRTIGLYHICFPDRVPSEIGSFNYFWTSCIVNPDLYPDSNAYATYSQSQVQRYYMLWAMLFFYALAVLFLAVTMLVGITACWKQKGGRLGITTFFLAFAIFFLAVVALLWHLIFYYEHNAIKMPSFPAGWDASLAQSSDYAMGFSYIVFVASLVLLVVAGLAFAYAWYCVKRKSDDDFDKQQAYLHYVNTSDKQLMPYTYGSPYGVGTYYPNYYSQYPTMSNSNYYGYLTYGH